MIGGKNWYDLLENAMTANKEYISDKLCTLSDTELIDMPIIDDKNEGCLKLPFVVWSKKYLYIPRVSIDGYDGIKMYTRKKAYFDCHFLDPMKNKHCKELVLWKARSNIARLKDRLIPAKEKVEESKDDIAYIAFMDGRVLMNGNYKEECITEFRTNYAIRTIEDYRFDNNCLYCYNEYESVAYPLVSVKRIIFTKLKEGK